MYKLEAFRGTGAVPVILPGQSVSIKFSAGKTQILFGGIPQSETMVISKVESQYPVPAVQDVIKVTVN